MNIQSGDIYNAVLISSILDNLLILLIFHSVVIKFLYKHQNFLKVVVCMIIIEQCNQTKHLCKIQVMVIYSSTFLVSVTSECSVKRSICQTRTGTLANSADRLKAAECSLHSRIGNKISKGDNCKISKHGSIGISSIPMYSVEDSIHYTMG